MLYTTLTINGTDYKARLTARSCVDLEKKLKSNPLNVFMKIANSGELPELESLILILQAAISSYNHNFSIDKAYELYDEFIDEGHTMVDLIPMIMDVFKVSGFFKEESAKEENIKEDNRKN